MEFRLTYQGVLLSTQQDHVNARRDKRADHKHEIRKVFHAQLKRLWEITPFLQTGERSGPDVFVTESSGEGPIYDKASLAAKHAKYGFNWVPLVTHDLNLICGLDILFLRPDKPGGVYWAGDIDNRLKTLFDALQIPDVNEHYEERTQGADENPFFCLLEEDKLITKLAVETDQLLESTGHEAVMNQARLIITVRLRPYDMHLGNMQFG